MNLLRVILIQLHFHHQQVDYLVLPTQPTSGGTANTKLLTFQRGIENHPVFC